MTNSGSIGQVIKKMKSLSEIETTAKRASKAAGFSWGEAEEIGKCIRQLELFGLPGIKHLNSYFNDCLLYTSPSPRDPNRSRMPSSA